MEREGRLLAPGEYDAVSVRRKLTKMATRALEVRRQVGLRRLGS